MSLPLALEAQHTVFGLAYTNCVRESCCMCECRLPEQKRARCLQQQLYYLLMHASVVEIDRDKLPGCCWNIAVVVYFRICAGLRLQGLMQVHIFSCAASI